MRVLVVEDNPVDLRLLRALIEADGHQSMAFPSASGVLDAVAVHRPDVALIDLHLPDTNGLELVRALRTLRAMRDVGMVALTAYPQRYTSRQAFGVGCSGWIVKPIDTRRLMSELYDVCARVRGEPAP